MDKLTKEQRRKNMQAVKSHGSKIELALAKELWKRGHRYRKNDKTVFGKPDLTFKKIKLAIFVDSEFWHGKNWTERKHDHKTNQQFWYNKIERNIKRDEEVNAHLTKTGWKVLRFWGNDIKKILLTCVAKVEQEIEERKNEIKRENIA
jgi:DNA mismatch endonuclease Vsr